MKGIPVDQMYGSSCVQSQTYQNAWIERE